MRKFFLSLSLSLSLFIFLMLFIFGLFNPVSAQVSYCFDNIFIKEVDQQNVFVGEDINGEMIVELTCLSVLCYMEPKIDYGDGSGIQVLSGGSCSCITETSPVKRVRCSYNFSHHYATSGEYIIIPKGGYYSQAWGVGGLPASYDVMGSGSIKINVFERPTAGPGQGAGNPLATSTVAGLVKTVTNVIYVIAYMLTVLFIMLGGFMIITSSGKPEQITKGRKIVLYTIIAFAILVAARGIINLIFMIIDVPTRI